MKTIIVTVEVYCPDNDVENCLRWFVPNVIMNTANKIKKNQMSARGSDGTFSVTVIDVPMVKIV